MRTIGIHILAIFGLLVIAQGNPLNGQLSSPLGDDVDAQELRSIIVEGWETKPWQAEPFPRPEAGVMLDPPKLVEGRPKNLADNENNKQSMAIRFRFTYPGNNRVTLTPPEDRTVKRYLGQLDENNEPKYTEIPGIKLPGKVEAVSVWVMGRGNDYNLEGWIEDWTGDTHIYDFGNLDYVGWRPLKVEIPEVVPQAVDSYPQTKTLVFKKFVIRSTRQSSQEEVVLFFDSLKVLTDIYELYFDGADMYYDDEDKQKFEEMEEYREQLKRRAAGEQMNQNNNQ